MERYAGKDSLAAGLESPRRQLKKLNYQMVDIHWKVKCRPLASELLHYSIEYTRHILQVISIEKLPAKAKAK